MKTCIFASNMLGHDTSWPGVSNVLQLMLFDDIENRDLLSVRGLPQRRHPRAGWHDYNGGMYFVTVCTKDMKSVLARISDREIYYSEVGQILNSVLAEVECHFQDANVVEYVVMPNHFHAIIHIADGQMTAQDGQFDHFNSRLAVVVGNIKAAVTRRAKRRGYDFAWQPRFHEHIIRRRNEYREIRHYIKGNVTRWSDDRYNQNE